MYTRGFPIVGYIVPLILERHRDYIGSLDLSWLCHLGAKMTYSGPPQVQKKEQKILTFLPLTIWPTC